MSKALELVEQAAEMLVLLEPDDAAATTALRDRLMALVRAVGPRGPAVARQAARAAAGLLEDLLGGRVADAGRALTTVGRTVSALQSMIRDKRNPDEIAFPPELELAREDSAPAEEPPPAPATEEPAAPQPPPAPLPVAGPPEPAPEAPPPPTAPARPPAESASSQPDADARASPTQLAGKYLTFRLAAEEFGIEILRVQEIIKLLDITRVPRTPDFIRGVINLRGKVIPVIDLRIKFGMPAQAATDKTCIVVVQVKRGESILTVGIIVDEVSEVLEVAAAEIEPPPAFGAAVDTAFILGMAKTRGAVRILLDISRVLTEGASGQ